MPATTKPLAKSAARPTLLDEIRGCATIPLHSANKPNYAGLMGLSRWSAYKAARVGEVETVKVGTRVLVKVPPLRRQLGDLPAEAAAQ